MNVRQRRLNEVYEYVRQFRGIHTKTDFAEALHYGRSSMSAALNGNELYLTDSLFKNICASFPGTFSLDYLLKGEGELLVSHTPPQTAVSIKQEKESDILSDLHSLRNEMKDELTLLRQARHELQEATEELRTLILSQRSQYYPNIAAEDTATKYNKPTKNPQ